MSEVANTLGIGFTVIDRSMRVQLRNQVAEEWFPEVHCGTTHCFAGHWGRSTQCPDCLSKLVFRTHEPQEGLRVYGKPGDLRGVYRICALPVSLRRPQETTSGLAGGAPQWVVETLIRFRSRSLLPESSSALESALTRSPSSTASLVIDTEQRVVSWSEAATAILGYRQGEILGRRVGCLFPEGPREEILAALDRARTTGRMPRREVPLLDKSGQRVSGVLSTSALTDETGKLIGQLGTIEDLSEIRELRTQLDLHARLLGRLAEEVGGALLSADPRGEVLSVSSESETLLGLPADQAVGRPLTEVIGAEAAAQVEEMARRSETFQGKRMHWTTPDGRHLDVEVSAACLVGGEEEDTCLAILARDAAESLVVERRMVRSEKLAAVGSLAAGLAHEIGTPLNVISATAEYLLLDQPEEGGSRAELKAIVEETERIGGLVRELLDYARESTSELEPLCLRGVAEKAIGFVRISVEKAGAVLESDLDPDTPLVQANANELHQVLVNLILNASQAAGSGGHIVVRVAPEAGELPGVLCEVHDDGPGIPSENWERVFDPFFTTRSEGTGLGLSVCSRIVRGLEGDLRITESPLGGACFQLRLPALTEPGEPPGEAVVV